MAVFEPVQHRTIDVQRISAIKAIPHVLVWENNPLQGGITLINMTAQSTIHSSMLNTKVAGICFLNFCDKTHY